MSIIDQFKQYKLNLILRIFKFILRKLNIIIETYYLLKLDLEKFEINLNKYDFSDITELNFKDLENINYFSDKKKEIFQKRLDSNKYSCYGIKVNGELQYLTWISWEEMNYPLIFDKSEKLLLNEALLEDSFCYPEFRGKGYHSKMNLFRINEIKKRDKKTIYALVLKENYQATKVQLNSGFKFIEKITFIKIFNKKLIKHKKLNDNLH